MNAPSQSLTPVAETFAQATDGHGDLEILTAFEAVRGARATIYSHDNDVEPGLSDDDMARLDAIWLEAESGVYGNWATTPSGVAARLKLAIANLAEDRATDSTLMQHGLLALYNQRKDMDHRIAQVTQAAYELMHIEWDLALAEYERSKARFEDALCLKGFVEREAARIKSDGDWTTSFLQELTRRIDEIEDRASNEREIANLFRTPAPDLTAYKQKVEIAVAEGLEKDVAAHLVRDANFLFASLSNAPIRTAAKEA